MKDYTKYDFGAIVGAKVEITQNGGHKYSGTLKLVGRQNGAILLYPSDEKKPAYWVVIEDIVPGSLSARIKVEDMSVNQLKRLLETYQDPVSEHAFVITEDGVYHSVLSALKEIGKQDFTDYIDCTDWGWKE